MSIEELVELVTRSKKALGRRSLLSKDVRPRLRTPGEIAVHLRPLICGLKVEQFWVMAFNSRNTLVGERCRRAPPAAADGLFVSGLLT